MIDVKQKAEEIVTLVMQSAAQPIPHVVKEAESYLKDLSFRIREEAIDECRKAVSGQSLACLDWPSPAMQEHNKVVSVCEKAVRSLKQVKP